MSNPTWCLRDNHVHLILQMVLDHWSDWWGVERIDLPLPLRKRDGIGREIYRRMKLLRVRQLEEGHLRFPPVEFNANTCIEDLWWPERRLYAAIIRRAILDFCQFYVSPYKSDQRIALNAYWWFMGYPPLMPLALSWADRQDINRGALVRHMLKPSDDPFKATGLRREDLWKELDGRVIDLEVDTILGMDMADWTSADACCHILGLDLKELRRRLHIVPPTWGD